MVDIQSKEVIDKMSEELKVQPSMALPRTLVNTIQPVYNVNPVPFIKLRGAAISTSTGSTTSLLPAQGVGKRVFITAMSLQNSKDATSNATSAVITGSMNGQGTTFMILPLIVGAGAQSSGYTMTFEPAIELTENTALLFGSTFTLGTQSTSATVFGYVIDPL